MLLILEVRGVVVDIGGESGLLLILLLILEVRGVFGLLILEVRGGCLILEVRSVCCC